MRNSNTDGGAHSCHSSGTEFSKKRRDDVFAKEFGGFCSGCLQDQTDDQRGKQTLSHCGKCLLKVSFRCEDNILAFQKNGKRCKKFFECGSEGSEKIFGGMHV